MVAKQLTKQFSTSIRNATVDPLIEVEVALFHMEFYEGLQVERQIWT